MGAEVIVNLSNDSWFGGTRGARLHLVLSALRSVENRRAQIRATNTGITAFIDASGEIRERSDEELVELERDLRDQLVRLSVAKATQRLTNTSQFSRIRRDIARVKTIQSERARGFTDTSGDNASTQEEANS